jgi:small GTP-binding protein
MSKISYKVIIMGKYHVGKTSLMNKLVYGIDKYVPDPSSTIGASYFNYEIDKNHSIDFWDTAGQERFNSLLKLYYRDADLIILVFDMNDYKDTIQRVKEYIKCIDEVNSKTKFILVGNKYDLVKPEQVLVINNYIKKIFSTEKYNEQLIALLNTSAKTNYNLEQLRSEVLEYIDKLIKSKINPKINEDKQLSSIVQLDEYSKENKKGWFQWLWLCGKSQP